MEGLKEWLDAIYTVGIPTAVVSCLDRRHMLESLHRMGLSKYFQVRYIYCHIWPIVFASVFSLVIGTFMD